MNKKEEAQLVLAKVYKALYLYSKGSGANAALKASFELLSKIRNAHDPKFEKVFSNWMSDVQDTLGELENETEKAAFISTIKNAFNLEDVLTEYGKVVKDFVYDFQSTFEDTVANEVNVQIDWDKVNPVVIDKIVNSTDSYLSDFGEEQSTRITQIIADGVKAGDDSRTIGKALSEGMNTIEYESGRTIEPEAWGLQTARTAIQEAYISNTREAFKDADLTSWMWLCASDEITCEECNMNDEEVRTIGDTFPDGSEQPGDSHANCRCTVICVLSDILDNADTTDSEEDNSD